jgi:hypothetical protein
VNCDRSVVFTGYSVFLHRHILYNYCTSLSAIWCVMEYWKAILTKAEGRGQYCFSVLHNTSYCGLGQYYFSVLHNTSYCTKLSAVIVLLNDLTFPVFFCTWIQFWGLFVGFVSNSKAHELNIKYNRYLY